MCVCVCERERERDRERGRENSRGRTLGSFEVVTTVYTVTGYLEKLQHEHENTGHGVGILTL